MKKSKFTDLVLFIVTAELVGAVSALIAGDFSAFYAEISQPPLAPPASVFPAVWGVLYALMGISAFLVFSSGRTATLKIYIFQLMVNFLWSIIFFRCRLLTLSAVVAVLLAVLVGIMIKKFSEVSKISAVLNVPYLLWSAFASYLTIAICIIN